VSAVIAVVGSAAGGVDHLRGELVEPFLALGHTVTLTLTPAAARWMEDDGEAALIAAATGYPVRSAARLPHETSPHPPADVLLVAPATANSVAKIAVGIADSQALTVVNESLGVMPAVLFPRVNAAHARHPAWPGHLQVLRAAGVHLVYGPEVWPLHEPRTQPGRPLPWTAIRDATLAALPRT
jgi:phosphopantothenoylcysteine synthetase/decarboxylase